MKVLGRAGSDDVALVYLAEFGGGKAVEFVESLQPPIPRSEKWVLIVSTLFGCPVGCRFCDAGSFFRGRLDADQILAQIDYLVRRRFPSGRVPVRKFKIQFARMGDPAFNEAVLDLLDELPGRYDAPGLMPSISTIAPEGTERFFERLLEIKRNRYGGRFQLQFSIHSTDEMKRDWLIPAPKWNLERIAGYGGRFHEPGDRKITLNFALAEGVPVCAVTMRRIFDPGRFIIKITPVNPTIRARDNAIASHVLPGKSRYEAIEALEKAGFDVLLSIGELEENHIGSNCGQYVNRYLDSGGIFEAGYGYKLEPLEA